MSFERKFRKLLKENDLDRELERDAMEDVVDDGVSPNEYDVDLEPDFSSEDDVADAFSKQTQEIVSKLETWESQVEQFLELINGDNPESIQSQLASAEPDTVMDKMKQSTQSKVARVASDLASLHQTILGFKAQASNSKFKGV